MSGVTGTIAVTADRASPVLDLTDAAVAPEFIGRTSVAQSCLAIAELALPRALPGRDLSALAAQRTATIVEALTEEPLESEQFTSPAATGPTAWRRRRR
ncbi:hypothetical protein [Streptomyces sp. NPDC005374]|uniref:hypothetical protein n=1 Tax=Streptomyces sp. NPDC005374 TaxID=3364713 RepID=UPI0036CC08BE